MTLEKNCVPYMYVQQTSEKGFDNEQINIRLHLILFISEYAYPTGRDRYCAYTANEYLAGTYNNNVMMKRKRVHKYLFYHHVGTFIVIKI